MTAVPSLFSAALGPDFQRLPGPVQALHRPARISEWQGEARITGGPTILARLIARLAGFPPPASSIPIRVHIESQACGERWTRWFGPHRLRSTIRPGLRLGTVVERFGPFRFEMALAAGDGGLRQAVSQCRFGPVRLPCAFAPGGGATEDVDTLGRYRFVAEATLPWGTRLVRYEGWLVPATGAAAPTERMNLQEGPGPQLRY